MAIEKTTKYKVFKKYQSLDNGATWILVEPEEAEYMAWEQNSIDCGYKPPTTGGTTGRCETIVTYKDGTTKEFSIINKEINMSSIGITNSYESEVTSIDIGTCVTSIDDRAFAYCLSLKSVEIPASIYSIGDNAFEGCSHLESIDIPGSVTSIGRYGFHTCYDLKAVTLGNGISSISDGAFYGCSGLTSIIIPESIKNCGGYLFKYCRSLSAATLPNSITNIGEDFFAECSSLSTLIFKGTIEQWSSITKGDNWNDGVPATVVHCTDGDVDLTGADITTGGCETVVTYKNDRKKGFLINGEITSSSIKEISAATKVDIGNCATGIGAYAFSEGEDIESITMGNSIKYIADYAFSSCWLLTSLVIESGVTSIGDYAFQNCNALDLIHYQGTKEQWYAIEKGEKWNYSWSSYKWAKTIQCTDGNITYR